MSFRDELAKVIAGDSQHSIEAYAFILEALQLARSRKLRAIAKQRKASDRRAVSSEPEKGSSSPKGHGSSKAKSRRTPEVVGHVTGQEFCESARRLALRQFGFLAGTILESWGIRTTSNMGDVVYNLIASGHLEKTSQDLRSDFDDVYDFKTAFQPNLASIAREIRLRDAEMDPGF
jgi:uncharacterized repeat protein (TIGR04138 family)